MKNGNCSSADRTSLGLNSNTAKLLLEECIQLSLRTAATYTAYLKTKINANQTVKSFDLQRTYYTKSLHFFTKISTMINITFANKSTFKKILVRVMHIFSILPPWKKVLCNFLNKLIGNNHNISNIQQENAALFFEQIILLQNTINPTLFINTKE